MILNLNWKMIFFFFIIFREFSFDQRKLVKNDIELSTNSKFDN